MYFTVRAKSEASPENGFMRNLGYLGGRPDRQIYDAVVSTQETLRSLPGSGRKGNAEIVAAIIDGCEDGNANPFEVLRFIAGEQESKVKHGGGFEEAAVKGLDLTTANVDRGVIAASRELYHEAVAENRLNVEALLVVRAMADAPLPSVERGEGSPLHDHVKGAVYHLFGFDVNTTPQGSVARHDQWEHARDISKRTMAFFRVVAKDHPSASEGKLWSKYLDAVFSAGDDSSHNADDVRRMKVQRQITDPAVKIIEQRMAEIDEIIAETRRRQRRPVRALLRALRAGSLLRKLGPSPRGL